MNYRHAEMLQQLRRETGVMKEQADKVVAFFVRYSPETAIRMAKRWLALRLYQRARLRVANDN